MVVVEVVFVDGFVEGVLEFDVFLVRRLMYFNFFLLGCCIYWKLFFWLV